MEVALLKMGSSLLHFLKTQNGGFFAVLQLYSVDAVAQTCNVEARSRAALHDLSSC